MDWIIWLVVIVAIVAVVWWLLNRNNSRGGSDSTAGGGTAASAQASKPASMPDTGHGGALSGGGAAASAAAAATTGIPTAAGFSQAEPEPPTTADDTTAEDTAAAEPPADEPYPHPAAAAPTVPGAGESPAPASTDWETQWSETPAAEPQAAVRHEPVHGGSTAHVGTVAEQAAAAGPQAEEPTATAGLTAAADPVHHPEYTEPHAPTLPGAESAAAEAAFAPGSETEPAAAPAAAPADGTAGPAAAEPAPLAVAETRQMAASSAAAETAASHTADPAGHPDASHTAEPAGHLALDQPYGDGSASPAADGSGPDGFTVKGNASSMIYHEDTSPAFEETTAEVWFLSPAHAEAAGFRPPRRSRQ